MATEPFLRFPKSNERPPQFGLRRLFIGVALAALLIWSSSLAYEQWRAGRIRDQSFQNFSQPYRVADDDVRALASTFHDDKIKRLDLSGSQITDAALQHVAKITTLESLNLAQTRVTDAGIPHLLKLPALSEISFADTPIGLQNAVDFSRARPHVDVFLELGFFRGHLRDGRLELNDLNFDHWGTRNFAPGQLRTLRSLRSLAIYADKFTDADLAALHGLQSIETLTLVRTAVTARGLADLLAIVQPRELHCPAKLNHPQVNELRERFPSCAMLGPAGPFQWFGLFRFSTPEAADDWLLDKTLAEEHPASLQVNDSRFLELRVSPSATIKAGDAVVRSKPRPLRIGSDDSLSVNLRCDGRVYSVILYAGDRPLATSRIDTTDNWWGRARRPSWELRDWSRTIGRSNSSSFQLPIADFFDVETGERLSKSVAFDAATIDSIGFGVADDLGGAFILEIGHISLLRPKN